MYTSCVILYIVNKLCTLLVKHWCVIQSIVVCKVR